MKKARFFRFLNYSVLLALALPYSLFAKPLIVTSIHPITLITTAITGDHANIKPLLDQQASPHDFTLKPSHLKLLEQADLVVWTGPALEHFMTRLLPDLVQSEHRIEWLSLADMTLYDYKTENHHEGEHEDDHHHGSLDPHVWLDPDNAIILAKAIHQKLIAINPQQSDDYDRNLEVFISSVRSTDQQLQKQLEPVKKTKYLVFHDAYGYLQRHYGLDLSRSVTINPEQRPGLRKVLELRQWIKEQEIACVIKEPQFDPALLDSLLENSEAGVAEVNPLGTDIVAGKSAYVEFLRQIATRTGNCLKR